MLPGWVILLASFSYLGVLFAIAFHADRRARAGASIINNPWVYALSLAVYATSWTFYGSVGRAAESGVGFLPIYLGPTLMMALGWTVLRKIIRISKTNRITSIADFIASRYGKSAQLAALVTLVAVIGVVPYIALQLKAVSGSLAVLADFHVGAEHGPWWMDTTLYIALLLAAFTIVFGTRHLDAAERHEGMVAAIAFESLVKLAAFLAVGLFVTFGMYQGFADLFRQAETIPRLQALFTMDSGVQGGWGALIVLSMLAVLLLPRQFQIAVVENVDEKHLDKAVWLLPLYLLLINVFVLPIAFAGVMQFSADTPKVDADTFVLTLPLAAKQQALALLVFIGGLSAATGMVIVETIALSTMVCNDLVMPLLLRANLLRTRADLSRILLNIRRGAIVVLLVLGYAYFRLAGETSALVSIGLISFAAVAQLAPAMLGGIYWKNGSRQGALAGLCAGFMVWLYTLFLPSLSQSGWLSPAFAGGPYGIEWLEPQQLFGLRGLDPVSHALFWSMLANIGAYVGVSLTGTRTGFEEAQARLFVDGNAGSGTQVGRRLLRGQSSADALLGLLRRFLGPARADEASARFGGKHADTEMMRFTEMELAGAIGAASARAVVAAVATEERPGHDELMAMLDETSQVISYSHALEQKSRELEIATAELRAANQRLTQLDRMKDDFISTVTHELRTPLTSIRAFSEILRDHPGLPAEKRAEYLGIVIKESERLTRLINDVLDLAKIESGSVEWHVSPLDMKQVIRDAAGATSQLFAEAGARLELHLPATVPAVYADHDRLMQVMLNLLSNALKFCDKEAGLVTVSLEHADDNLRVTVSDNGPGVRPQDREVIFDRFRQGGDLPAGKPQGTGLGLPICREIIRHFGGSLWLASSSRTGAEFVFTLPLSPAMERTV